MRKIGRHSFIGEPSNITNSVEIGNFSSIAPYVQIHDLVQHDKKGITTYPFKDLPEPRRSHKHTIIGSDVWIGQGAILLNGITVGDGAIIGAYAVVASNVEPYAVIIGNPAQPLYYRFSQRQIDILLRIKWWEWADKLIHKRIIDFQLPIEDFITKYDKIHSPSASPKRSI